VIPCTLYSARRFVIELPGAMAEDDINKEALRKQFEDASEAELEAALKKPRAVSNIAQDVLRERRLELRRSARIIAWATVVTAIATAAAALAAWTAIFFQYGHTAPNEFRQPAASITPAAPLPSTR